MPQIVSFTHLFLTLVTFYFLRVFSLKTNTPWFLVRKGNIPTDRPRLVGEIKAYFCR
jgi:hypothetical protein